MEFLYFLESVRNPVCDFLASAITYLGHGAVYVVVGVLFLWCVDKYDAYYILCTGFIGTVINHALKLACRIPRPWVRNPDFTIVESARAGAEGYSFPSGHSQNAVATFGCIAIVRKEKWIRCTCIAAACLVPLSRMYLGVHTPLDVSVGAACALALVLALRPLFRQARKHPGSLHFLFFGMLLLGIAFLLYAYLFPFPADMDTDNLYAGLKNGWLLVGGASALWLFFLLDTHIIHYQTEASLPAQILKTVFGLAVVLGVLEGFKYLTVALIGKEAYTNAVWLQAVRYFLTTAAAGAWTLTFPLFTRLFPEKTEK